MQPSLERLLRYKGILKAQMRNEGGLCPSGCIHPAELSGHLRRRYHE
jgi:hypothetical protein